MTIKNELGKCLRLVAMMQVLPVQAESKQEITMPMNTSEWQALEKKRVVFGRQSVGENILNGVERLAARDSVKINIHEQRTSPESTGISHFTIGKNSDPMSKIQDFAGAIDAGAAQGLTWR